MGFLSSLVLGLPSGEKIAKKMAKRIQRRLFRLLLDKKFWEAGNLYEQDDEELKRVTFILRCDGLAMSYMMMDTAARFISNPDQKELYSEIKNNLVEQYVAMLEPEEDSDESEQEVLAGWQQGVARQCEELRESYESMARKGRDARQENLWVDAAAINVMAHILEDQDSDEAIDTLLEILIPTYGEISADVLDQVIKALPRI